MLSISKYDWLISCCKVHLRLTFLFRPFSFVANCLCDADPFLETLSWSTSVFSSIEPYWIVLEEFQRTRSARASVIPSRQSSHLQIDVDRSEILSDFWERWPMEKNEELESIELVRGKLARKEPPPMSPESKPMITNNNNDLSPESYHQEMMLSW